MADEILPRVEIYKGETDWNYRLIQADGTTVNPAPHSGVWGRPMVAMSHAYVVYPDLPFVVIPATE